VIAPLRKVIGPGRRRWRKSGIERQGHDVDLVIRGGVVIDGTGGPGFRADVGVIGERIAAIGTVAGRGKREIDAEGHIVTPGFIDAHTHMDAQMHWDPLGTCSSLHGVTSVVMGNCGFTLAPSRAHERHLIVRNLERAEDISGEAMAAGIRWEWETFPEYLDALDRLPKAINYAANIGHSALRTWVMGEAAFERASTDDEVAEMARQVEQALEAGAVGFSTSRNPAHETSDDRPVASRIASWQEVCRLVHVLKEQGVGMFELSKEREAGSRDPKVRREALARMRSLAVESGVPMSFGLVATQGWRDQLDLLTETRRMGGRMYGQSHSRGMNVLMSFRTHMPFDGLPEWQEIRSQPLEAQLRLLADPSIRERLIHAAHHGDYPRVVGAEARKPDWKEVRVRSGPFPPYPLVAEVAAAKGCDPVELMIDLALASDFDQFFIQSAIPGEEQKEADVLSILRHPQAVMTFSDTGAHVTQIADFSIQTHLLAYWSRQRQEFTVEEAVRMISGVPAQAWGFEDRGVLKEGMAADLNVIDFERLAPGKLEVRADLPAGAKRLVQGATGIRATVVAGRAILEEGRPTGALPGRVLRNPKAKQARSVQ
jgi:N-acyl-D-aspartate/D-glutamate deacylase